MTRLGFLAIAAAALSALQGVSGHYQLTYPQSRGFVEETEPLAPCGGFNSVGSSRSEFPLQDGFVQINSGHTDYTYEVKFIDNSNPSTADFNNATVIAKGSRSYPAEACLPVDLGSVAGASAGANGTIQVTYDGGDGTLYQCADVTLADNPSSFNQTRCVNADGSNPTGTGAPSDENAASVLRVAGGVMIAAVAAALSIAA